MHAGTGKEQRNGSWRSKENVQRKEGKRCVTKWIWFMTQLHQVELENFKAVLKVQPSLAVCRCLLCACSTLFGNPCRLSPFRITTAWMLGSSQSDSQRQIKTITKHQLKKKLNPTLLKCKHLFKSYYSKRQLQETKTYYILQLLLTAF